MTRPGKQTHLAIGYERDSQGRHEDMSTKLPIVDLTGAVVGTQETIDFNQFTKFDPATKKPAHLRIYNDSGCGLDYTMKQSGDSDYCPAGGWATIELADNDSQMVVTVNYLLPNPPVSKILPTYYAPGEPVPPIPILGNSPVGIGGSVATSSVQTLSNEGGAANILIIDIGDAAFSQLIAIYSDGHVLWAVDQSGTKHQVLKIQTAGNPLQLGQAGDITEVLGQLTVDQDATLSGNETSGAVGKLLHALGNLTVDGTATLTGAVTATNASNSINASTLKGGANLPGGRLGSSADGDIIDASPTTPQDVYFKVGGVTSPKMHFQLPAGTDVATLQVGGGAGTARGNNGNLTVDLVNLKDNFISGEATGTVNVNAGTNVVVNHGLSGTPLAVMAICDVASTNDSISANTYTATQFTLSQVGGVNSNFKWLAIR